LSIRNDIKEALKTIWFLLQVCALAIASICIMWTITQFMSSDWSGRCATGIIMLVSLIYMVKLLMQTKDFQRIAILVGKRFGSKEIND
jgi:hypothetical protein